MVRGPGLEFPFLTASAWGIKWLFLGFQALAVGIAEHFGLWSQRRAQEGAREPPDIPQDSQGRNHLLSLFYEIDML